VTGADDHRVRRVELAISLLLRIGVLSSLAIVVAGAVVSFVRHPQYFTSPAELQRLTHNATFPHTMRQMWDGLKQGRGQSMIVFGLLLLIATPVIRVAVSILAFAYQRDWRFVIITAVVLALLILSFVLGRAGG
jgi:uncharacterized membrane protein